MIIYRLERAILSLYTNTWNKIMMYCNGIKHGSNFRSCGSVLFRNYGGIIEFGNNVYINSHQIADPIGGDHKTIIVCCESAKLIIGNNVGISNSTLFAQTEIVIDDEACIGAGCKIYDTDFHSSVAEYRLNGNTHVKTAPVYIGKRSFIGGHTIILKGVVIGEQSVVAAGSVVCKSIPPNEVWGGNPAKFIKKLSNV